MTFIGLRISSKFIKVIDKYITSVHGIAPIKTKSFYLLDISLT